MGIKSWWGSLNKNQMISEAMANGTFKSVLRWGGAGAAIGTVQGAARKVAGIESDISVMGGAVSGFMAGAGARGLGLGAKSLLKNRRASGNAVSMMGKEWGAYANATGVAARAKGSAVNLVKPRGRSALSTGFARARGRVGEAIYKGYKGISSMGQRGTRVPTSGLNILGNQSGTRASIKGLDVLRSSRGARL